MPTGVETGLVEAANRRVAKALRKVASDIMKGDEAHLSEMQITAMAAIWASFSHLADELEATTEGEDHG